MFSTKLKLPTTPTLICADHYTAGQQVSNFVMSYDAVTVEPTFMHTGIVAVHLEADVDNPRYVWRLRDPDAPEGWHDLTDVINYAFQPDPSFYTALIKTIMMLNHAQKFWLVPNGVEFDVKKSRPHPDVKIAVQMKQQEVRDEYALKAKQTKAKTSKPQYAPKRTVKTQK